METKFTKEYLLLIDEEVEIKKYYSYYLKDSKDIVKYMGDTNEPLEENEKVIIAYYPLTKEAKELDLPELPPFGKNIEIMWLDFNKNHNRNCPLSKEQFVRVINYKAAQSKGQYSLEDMRNIFILGGKHKMQNPDSFLIKMEEILESLSTQQLPKEFIPEYTYPNQCYGECGICDRTCDVKILKTITNSEGKQEIQGRYVY